MQNCKYVFIEHQDCTESNLPPHSICISRFIPRLEVSQMLRRIQVNELTLGIFFFFLSWHHYCHSPRNSKYSFWFIFFFLRKKCGWLMFLNRCSRISLNPNISLFKDLISYIKNSKLTLAKLVGRINSQNETIQSKVSIKKSKFLLPHPIL